MKEDFNTRSDTSACDFWFFKLYPKVSIGELGRSVHSLDMQSVKLQNEICPLSPLPYHFGYGDYCNSQVVGHSLEQMAKSCGGDGEGISTEGTGKYQWVVIKVPGQLQVICTMQVAYQPVCTVRRLVL